LVLASSHLVWAQQDTRLVPSIGVVGTGEVQAKPDLAQVSVGVLTQSKSAADAMKENSQKMAQLLEVLKRRAILEKDIQTTNINVSPRYEAERPGPEHAKNKWLPGE
jgi:hypothetical protein